MNSSDEISSIRKTTLLLLYNECIEDPTFDGNDQTLERRMQSHKGEWIRSKFQEVIHREIRYETNIFREILEWFGYKVKKQNHTDAHHEIPFMKNVLQWYLKMGINVKIIGNELYIQLPYSEFPLG